MIDKIRHWNYKISKVMTIFLILIIIGNTVGLTILINFSLSNKNDLQIINSKLENIEKTRSDDNSLPINDLKLIEYYKELSSKTDNAIDRILTIVGISTVIFSLFGLLVAYAAPLNINKRIEELNEKLIDANNSADEAKYQAGICSSMSNELRSDRIMDLKNLIKEYPDKPDAYLELGYLYYENKQFDIALYNYEIAKKHGCKQYHYYNNLGIIYKDTEYSKNDYKKALAYMSKAIECNSVYTCSYFNRALVYYDLKDYKKSVEDFTKTIELDEDFYEVYQNRCQSYYELYKLETDKQSEYKKLIIHDLEEAKHLLENEEQLILDEDKLKDINDTRECLNKIRTDLGINKESNILINKIKK